MTEDWQLIEATTHQDHVIAHVLGARPLAYFIHDETIHLFLDMGFVWSLYLDGQMVLMPNMAAMNELEVDGQTKQEIAEDLDRLMNAETADLQRIEGLPMEFAIEEVTLFSRGEKRRFVLGGDNQTVAIETSLESGEISVT